MNRKNKKQETINSTSSLTREELNILWDNATDPTAELLLIICYSGLGIIELQHLQINLEKKYFVCDSPKTGLRIIPIHSKILPLVEARMERQDPFPTDTSEFRKNIHQLFERLNITYRDAHVGRSTFIRMCHLYNVDRNCENQLLFGHNHDAGPIPLALVRIELEKI